MRKSLCIGTIFIAHLPRTILKIGNCRPNKALLLTQRQRNYPALSCLINPLHNPSRHMMINDDAGLCIYYQQ